MATSATFVYESAVLHPESVSTISIFDDVEAAKQRYLEMRKSGRRGPNTSFRNLESRTAPHPSRYVLEAETARVEVESQRRALETRKAEIQKSMMSLIVLIRNAATSKTPSSGESVSEDGIEEVVAAPKKKQRYFESKSLAVDVTHQPVTKTQRGQEDMQDDDLSSVVCPYELLGKCTDPACPHMHLNR